MDTEHIWCIGVVEIKIITKGRKPLLYIHYEVSICFFKRFQGWNRRFDEYIYLDSKRVAPLGTYTTRRDIPRYSYCPN